MQAAERIFDGAFDHIVDEPEDKPSSNSKVESSRKARMIVSTRHNKDTNHVINPFMETPEDGGDSSEDEEMEDVEDDEGDEYSAFYLSLELHTYV